MTGSTIPHGSAVLCEHANEVPLHCPCAADCYCKTHTCAHHKSPRVSGPTIKRGQSSGDIWTPKPFVRAVEAKFGPLAMDLAASPQSNCAPCYFTERDDALSDLRPWPYVRCWLNPPYADITPWAEKCARESAKGCEVLLLVPGSIGANWYWDWVEPYADVYSVGRLVFDNCYDKHGELVTTPYPKDLILCHYNALKITEAAFYGMPHRTQRMVRWHWRKELT